MLFERLPPQLQELIASSYMDELKHLDGIDPDEITLDAIRSNLQGEDINDEDISDPFTDELFDSLKDVNGDGDPDVAVADTNDNGSPDTAVVTADSKSEEKEAVKEAKKQLDDADSKNEKTSTGKTKKELSDKEHVVSDARQKNIISALIDHRF